VIAISLYGNSYTQSLIQPLPPQPISEVPETGSRRIEDFLQDCFLHPQLQQPLELCVCQKSLREVIQTIAQRANFSVVMDDSVSGMVPLLMARGEPMGSVLHALLTGRSSPLGMLIVDKVLHIASRATLVRRARQLLASSCLGKSVHATVPLLWLAWTEPLKLRLECMWQHCIRQHVGPARMQYFFADDESRSILIQGTPEQVALFKRMLGALDVSVPQVQIEARVVIARTDFMTKLGLRAQCLYGGGGLPPTSVGGEHTSSLPWALKTVAQSGAGLDLPITFGGTAAFMSTLLAPHIMSCSGKSAVLHEGHSIPIESFAEDSVEGRTRTVRSAQYRDVGVKVQLKPHVLADGQRVKIDMLVENSHISSTSTSTQFPMITTSKIHNTIILRDGQTVLLGGLTQKENSHEDAGVPWISKIPIIGWLFSGSSRAQQERRLYVFVHAQLLRHEA
jgi:type II secretory pathway component GspD/PulD (secretin)